MSTSEFSYIPESPEQSFGNNKGIFTPTDIYDLTRADKFTHIGQLELIQTQTVSSAVGSIIFQDIKEDEYDIHFITFSNINGVATATEELTLQVYESGVLEDGNVYQQARKGCRANGTYNEQRYTGYSQIRISNWDYFDNDGANGGYVYVYNAGDNTKYTYFTYHNTGFDSEYGGSGTYTSKYGCAILPQLSVVDGFKFKTLFSTNLGSGSVSIYGVKGYE